MLKILWLLWYYSNHFEHEIWFLVTYILIQWPRLKNYTTAISYDHFCFEFLYRFGGMQIYLDSMLLRNFHQVIDNMIYGWRFLPVNAMGDVWWIQFVLFDRWCISTWCKSHFLFLILAKGPSGIDFLLFLTTFGVWLLRDWPHPPPPLNGQCLLRVIDKRFSNFLSAFGRLGGRGSSYIPIKK